MPTSSAGENSARSSGKVSEQISARRCRRWLIFSAPVAERRHLGRQRAGIAVMAGQACQDRSDPVGIKHRCDPGPGQFGVMGKDCCGMRPAHPGARLDVPFQIVGMQFHQPRQHQIAVAIDRRRRDAAAAVHRRNHPAPQPLAAVYHLARQHQSGVGKDQVGGRFGHGDFLGAGRRTVNRIAARRQGRAALPWGRQTRCDTGW